MTQHIVTTHPWHSGIKRIEDRRRNTLSATREDMIEYLAPFRTEGYKTDPSDLARARLGYGIPLNRSWIGAIIGAVQGAPHKFSWGQFAPGADPQDGAPDGTLASELMYDITNDGKSYGEFEKEVAEWMLSGLGGIILVDSNVISSDADGSPLSAAAQRDAGMRPHLQFVPASAIVDFGRSRYGYRYVTVLEQVDERTPFDLANGMVPTTEYRVTYWLDGATTYVRRTDKNGTQKGADKNLGKFVDALGRPTLPLAEVRYGRDRVYKHLSASLVAGLDDIVIDLFNTVNEMREASRNSMGLLVIAGTDGDGVLDQVVAGSAVVNVGPEGDMKNLAADKTVSDAKVQEIELALKAWRLGAENKISEAAATTKASGVSLSVDFKLSQRPLLVSVAEAVQKVMTDALFIMAQMAGHTPDQANEVEVEIDATFSLEDEATMIANALKLFTDAGLSLPAEAKAKITMAWLRASSMIDMDAKATDGQTVGELIEDQIAQEGEAASRDRAAGAFAGLRQLAAGQPAAAVQAPQGAADAAV